MASGEEKRGLLSFGGNLGFRPYRENTQSAIHPSYARPTDLIWLDAPSHCYFLVAFHWWLWLYYRHGRGSDFVGVLFTGIDTVLASVKRTRGGRSQV